MKQLLSTTDPTVISYARVLLANEGIEAFELDVHTSALHGGIGILPRRLMVREGDHSRACALMRLVDIAVEE